MKHVLRSSTGLDARYAVYKYCWIIQNERNEAKRKKSARAFSKMYPTLPKGVTKKESHCAQTITDNMDVVEETIAEVKT